MSYKIAPSMLAADFTDLQSSLAKIGNADLLHVDIMDGHFVPPISFGPPVLKGVKTNLPLDIHLMVSRPDLHIPQLDFLENVWSIGFHVELEPRVIQTSLDQLKERKIPACLTIKPATPLEAIAPYVEQIDMLLVMTVEPGYGGQSFMHDQLPKVAEAKRLYPELPIQVDGGISKQTICAARDAGATLFVAGNAVFGAEDPTAEVEDLRKLLAA